MKDYDSGMKPVVKDFQKSKECYAETYDQAPLKYIERNDKTQAKAAKKLKSQKHVGRYE